MNSSISSRKCFKHNTVYDIPRSANTLLNIRKRRNGGSNNMHLHFKADAHNAHRILEPGNTVYNIILWYNMEQLFVERNDDRLSCFYSTFLCTFRNLKRTTFAALINAYLPF